MEIGGSCSGRNLRNQVPSLDNFRNRISGRIPGEKSVRLAVSSALRLPDDGAARPSYASPFLAYALRRFSYVCRRASYGHRGCSYGCRRASYALKCENGTVQDKNGAERGAAVC